VSARPEVSARAEADLAAARGWYAAIRPGLDDSLMLCVEETLDRIAENPRAFRAVGPDVRYARVRRFPYGVLYRVRDGRVRVEGVFHARRDPLRLEDRAGRG